MLDNDRAAVGAAHPVDHVDIAFGAFLDGPQILNDELRALGKDVFCFEIGRDGFFVIQNELIRHKKSFLSK